MPLERRNEPQMLRQFHKMYPRSCLVSEIRGTSKMRPHYFPNNIWDSERYKLNPTNIFFHNNIWSKRRKDAKVSIRPDIFTAKLAV